MKKKLKLVAMLLIFLLLVGQPNNNVKGEVNIDDKFYLYEYNIKRLIFTQEAYDNSFNTFWYTGKEVADVTDYHAIIATWEIPVDGPGSMYYYFEQQCTSENDPSGFIKIRIFNFYTGEYLDIEIDDTYTLEYSWYRWWIEGTFDFNQSYVHEGHVRVQVYARVYNNLGDQSTSYYVYSEKSYVVSPYKVLYWNFGNRMTASPSSPETNNTRAYWTSSDTWGNIGHTTTGYPYNYKYFVTLIKENNTIFSNIRAGFGYYKEDGSFVYPAYTQLKRVNFYKISGGPIGNFYYYFSRPSSTQYVIDIKAVYLVNDTSIFTGKLDVNKNTIYENETHIMVDFTTTINAIYYLYENDTLKESGTVTAGRNTIAIDKPIHETSYELKFENYTQVQSINFVHVPQTLQLLIQDYSVEENYISINYMTNKNATMELYLNDSLQVSEQSEANILHNMQIARPKAAGKYLVSLKATDGITTQWFNASFTNPAITNYTLVHFRYSNLQGVGLNFDVARLYLNDSRVFTSDLYLLENRIQDLKVTDHLGNTLYVGNFTTSGQEQEITIYLPLVDVVMINNNNFTVAATFTTNSFNVTYYIAAESQMSITMFATCYNITFSAVNTTVSYTASNLTSVNVTQVQSIFIPRLKVATQLPTTGISIDGEPSLWDKISAKLSEILTTDWLVEKAAYALISSLFTSLAFVFVLPEFKFFRNWVLRKRDEIAGQKPRKDYSDRSMLL